MPMGNGCGDSGSTKPTRAHHFSMRPRVSIDGPRSPRHRSRRQCVVRVLARVPHRRRRPQKRCGTGERCLDRQLEPGPETLRLAQDRRRDARLLANIYRRFQNQHTSATQVHAAVPHVLLLAHFDTFRLGGVYLAVVIDSCSRRMPTAHRAAIAAPRRWFRLFLLPIDLGRQSRQGPPDVRGTTTCRPGQHRGDRDGIGDRDRHMLWPLPRTTGGRNYQERLAHATSWAIADWVRTSGPGPSG